MLFETSTDVNQNAIISYLRGDKHLLCVKETCVQR